MIDDERELERRLRETAGAIRVPDVSLRAGRSRRSRGLPLALATSGALLISIVAGAAFGQWRAVNTPATSAPPSLPTAGPVSTDARFGWLAFSDGSVRVYDELGRARTEALPPVSSAVTSPNGRYVALWWQGNGGPSTLRVLDGATQQVGPVLFQTGEAASSKGATLAWASDNSAVVIATLNIRGAAQSTTHTIRTIDLAGTAQVVGTIDAVSASPVGWSRSQHRIGLIVSGSAGAGLTYVVLNESGAVMLRAEGEDVPIIADEASRFVVSYRVCGGCSRAFVVHDFATYAVVAEVPLAPTGGWGVLFRPGSSDLLVEQDSQDMTTMTFTLRLWPDVGRGTPRDVAAMTLPQGPGATTSPTWRFRADGSAVFFGQRNPDGTWTGDLIDLAHGSRVPLTVHQPLAAVLLAPAPSAATPPQAAFEFVAWPDGAQDGWVSPDAQLVVARLSDGIGLYRVNRASGLALEQVARLTLGAYGSGRWLDDSSGFIFESATEGRHPATSAQPVVFDLAVLERSGTLTRLTGGVPMYAAVFSRLSPDGRSIAIASMCCPQRVQIVPRDGGTPRDVVEGAPTAWDDRGRLFAYNSRDLIALASATAPGYRITVPPAPNEPGFVVSIQSSALDRSAFLVQTARTSGPQQVRILVDGRLLDAPDVGLPLLWFGAHELLLFHEGDGRFSAFDPLTGTLRTLRAALPDGGNFWGANGTYLAWSLRGMHITDVESGETRHIDLPVGDAGIAFDVTAPGTFVVTMRDGLRFVDAPTLFAQPAPTGQLRDRPTVRPGNTPDGLTLPPSCRYVRYVDTISFFGWEVDCGEGRNVSSTLETVLQNAGWVRCADLPTSTFKKGGRELVVAGATAPQQPLVLTERLLGTSCR